MVTGQRELREQRLGCGGSSVISTEKEAGIEKRAVTTSESYSWWWMVLEFEPWFAGRCRIDREDLAIY